jgi:transcription initiation factor TFIIIB Brf1 subunit/transcription initiation factor TFIIB
MEVTLVAASYRWHCPECGNEHFVRVVTECVSCQDCGCVCNVSGARHRSQGESAAWDVANAGRERRVPTQTALF